MGLLGEFCWLFISLLRQSAAPYGPRPLLPQAWNERGRFLPPNGWILGGNGTTVFPQ